MCIFNNGSLLAYTILYYTIGNLTIRNNANKKWSTVRANKRMSSGLHRWDVVIDRLAVLTQVGKFVEATWTSVIQDNDLSICMCARMG